MAQKMVREKSVRTRARILAAAERLFADKGFTGASMRDITAAAKVNLSVAYYYFENKEGLLLAVIERFIMPVMEKERALLERARAEAGTRGAVPCRRLVEALVLPRLEKISETANRLMAMLLARPRGSELKVLTELGKLTEALRLEFTAEFSRAFPALSEEEVRFRMVNMEALLNGWKVLMPLVKDERSEKVSKEEYFEMFISLLVQMFSAPPVLKSVPAEQRKS